MCLSPAYRQHLAECPRCKSGTYCGIGQAFYRDDNPPPQQRDATEAEMASLSLKVDNDGYPVELEYAGRNFKLVEI